MPLSRSVFCPADFDADILVAQLGDVAHDARKAAEKLLDGHHADLHHRFLQFPEHAGLKRERVGEFPRSGSFACWRSNSPMARCSIDLPMISSPTRFMTVSMRPASTRSVFSAAAVAGRGRRGLPPREPLPRTAKAASARAGLDSAGRRRRLRIREEFRAGRAVTAAARDYFRRKSFARRRAHGSGLRIHSAVLRSQVRLPSGEPARRQRPPRGGGPGPCRRLRGLFAPVRKRQPATASPDRCSRATCKRSRPGRTASAIIRRSYSFHVELALRPPDRCGLAARTHASKPLICARAGPRRRAAADYSDRPRAFRGTCRRRREPLPRWFGVLARPIPGVSTSSSSWANSLSSRKPQAAESPFSVCTARRTWRSCSVSPGLLFERQAGFVHALENLLGALEEELAKLGGVFVGRKVHCGLLDPLVHRRVVL